MRLRVRLRCEHVPQQLPLDANYHLTSLVYRLLKTSSQDYSAFLHDDGYEAGGKRFKLFTYSRLMLDDYLIEPPWIMARSPGVVWDIASPIDEFVEHLADGLLREGEIQLYDETFRADLTVERAEVRVLPPFTQQMRFVCRSPLVASRPVERDGRLFPHYFRPDEPGLAEAVRANLMEKYRLIHGEAPAADALTLDFDSTYRRRKKGKIEKLVDFKGTKIKGVLAPFTVTGSPELIRVGYEAGFGEKNSMGFGMVETVDDAAASP